MRNAIRCRVIAGALGATVALVGALAQQGELPVRNTYSYRGQGRFDWTVYLAADRATLKSIRCVEYTLHPTFSEPVQRVCNPAGGFALSTNGWGEFTILLKIEWGDGRVTRQRHPLDLHTPTVPPPKAKSEAAAMLSAAQVVPGPIRSENTATQLSPSEWRWTVYITAAPETLEQVRCVEYMLHPTFPKPLREVCERGSRPDQAFPLTAQGWGTFEVGIKVQFRDGSTRFLKHPLRFRQ